MAVMGTAEEEASNALLVVQFDEVGIFKGGGVGSSRRCHAWMREGRGGIVMGWGWRVGGFSNNAVSQGLCPLFTIQDTRYARKTRTN